MKVGTRVVYVDGTEAILLGKAMADGHSLVYNLESAGTVEWETKNFSEVPGTQETRLNPVYVVNPSRVGFWKIVFAIMISNILSGILFAIAYAGMK